jgi:hypothetical protein
MAKKRRTWCTSCRPFSRVLIPEAFDVPAVKREAEEDWGK